MQKKSLKYSIFIFFCILSAWLYFIFAPVVTVENGYVYYVRPGISKHAVISDLHQRGIIAHPFALLIYGLPETNASLKKGEYHFKKGSTPHSIWKQITTGTGLFYQPFAIIPGWTFKQLRVALQKAQGLRHDSRAMTDAEIMQHLDVANLSPEGEFYPDTYNYTRGDSDFVVLKRAFNFMQQKLQQAFNQRAEGLPYKNAYEALILASIIEREAYLDAERPIIAGVLMNRLSNDMLLQVDATVIFGLGDRYDGKIYKQNLLEDNPFNTYLHKGLPPTPIAMPGLASINAAMHPQQNDFYYYVVKGHGSHEFSRDLQAHHTAVESNLKR